MEQRLQAIDRPIVSIIVVSYNTAAMTIACLRSILAETVQNSFEILVVDNASTDGSADQIARDLPQVALIRSAENIGFARANNLAAQNAKGQFLLLLNPDTVIIDSAIDRLLRFAESTPDAGIWGGRTVFSNRELNPSSCWAFMSLWSLFAQAIGLTSLFRNSPIANPEGYGGWRRDTVRNVDIVTGCFLLIDHSLWKRLGGFDGNFFMYAEEADLCFRAKKLGALPIISPDAVIIHYGGASEPILSGKMQRLLSGKAHFLKKHWREPAQSMGIALLKLLVFVRCSAFLSLSVFSARFRTRAKEWGTVWQGRHTWSKGYVDI